jgi:hypothetical protein
MNLADVFTYLFSILGFIIVFIGYWLMAAALFPAMVERCAESVGRKPVSTTFIGAILFVPLVIIGFAISSKAPSVPVKFAGISIVLFSFLAALFGAAGLALRIGRGLKSARDEHEPWRRVLRGGIVLALTFVLPFVGTFVLMPFAFISGFGAIVRALFQREPQPEIAPAPSAVPPPLTSPVS